MDSVPSPTSTTEHNAARLRATNSACWRLQAWLLLPH